jgi:excinuclease ABC subunit C
MTAEDYNRVSVTLPHLPGIYKFVDADGKILYVGKAKNLFKRVSSYFNKNQTYYKTAVMVKKSAAIEFTIVENEKDALLLENTLIKNHQPKFNINLKDDKSYPFIIIKNENFPRIFFTRRFIDDGSEYYGPYTSLHKSRDILDFVKTIFPLRTCNLLLTKKNIEAHKFKVCLEFHIGNCKGPCENLQSEEQYNENIKQIRNLLKGKVSVVLQHMKDHMHNLATEMKFEEAQQWKEKIEALHLYQQKSAVVNPDIDDVDVFSWLDDKDEMYVNYMRVVDGAVVQSKTTEVKMQIDELKEDVLEYTIHELRNQLRSQSKEIIIPLLIQYPDPEITLTVPLKGDKLTLLELSQRNLNYYKMTKLLDKNAKESATPAVRILSQLQSDFHLKDLPVHIECFDNSNFQGSYPVASMVCFKNAKPSKKDYRHFNIKTVIGPDDFASMSEIVYRRYKRLLDENLPLPQLILIDGGKGQLGAAMESLLKLNLIGRVAVAGIAKRLEEIYLPNDPMPLYINKKSESLRLIQQIRDEAHRFAITFHRNKRSKGTFKTELIDIKGIGDETSTMLLKKYRSVQKILETPDAELEALIGQAKTKLIRAHFAE